MPFLLIYCGHGANYSSLKSGEGDKILPNQCEECGPSKGGTAVIPNISLITGKVLKYGKENVSYINIITVSIDSVIDYGNKPNFLRGKEGQEIIFYSKEDLSQEIVNKKISGEASFRGDEGGGKWWLSNIKIIQ